VLRDDRIGDSVDDHVQHSLREWKPTPEDSRSGAAEVLGIELARRHLLKCKI
jgi:hypothetical protein